MNLCRNQTRRALGVTSETNLSERERELADAWENADPEFLKQCKETGIEPDLGMGVKFGGKPDGHDGSTEDRDPYAPISLLDWYAQENRDHRDEEEPKSKDMVLRRDIQEAVLRVLYTLCNARHPKLRLATDCLLAIINKSDESSQAEIARKHGLSRAAISKRLRDMRSCEFLEELEIYYFGGRLEVAEASQTRAKRVHKQIEPYKTKCKAKPSPFELARSRKTA